MKKDTFLDREVFMKSMFALTASILLSLIVISCGIDSKTPWLDPIPEEDQVQNAKLNKYAPLINFFPEGKSTEHYYFEESVVTGSGNTIKLYYDIDKKERKFTLVDTSLTPELRLDGSWAFKRDANKNEYLKLISSTGAKVWGITIKEVNEIQVITFSQKDRGSFELTKKNVKTETYNRAKNRYCKLPLKKSGDSIIRLLGLTEEEKDKEKVDIDCRVDLYKEAIKDLVVAEGDKIECKKISKALKTDIEACPKI